MNKQDEIKLIDNHIKLTRSEILHHTKWLLLDKKELISYFEDFIWKNKDLYQGITEKKEFGEYPKDFQNRVRDILEDLEDKLSAIDFYLDDSPSFLYQNFWILISDMIKDGVSTEFADLVLEEIPFSEANEKSEKLMIEAIKSMKYEVSLAEEI